GQAKSNKAVTDAVNNGTVAINKEAANAAIDGALAEKNNSIDDAPNLTDEEKQSVKAQAKTAADDAKTAISNASTVGDVTTAKNTGVDNINKVSIPAQSDAKQKASANIDDVAKAAKQAIDETSGLTDDQKQTAKGQVDADAQAAKQAIGQAKSNKAVTDAVNNGTVAINKEAANAAIDGALAEKNNSIDDAPKLTDEEQQPLKAQPKTATVDAYSAINHASTNSDATTPKYTHIDNITQLSIPAQSDPKKKTSPNIDDVAKAAKQAI